MLRGKIKGIAIAMNVFIAIVVLLVYQLQLLKPVDLLLFDQQMKQTADHQRNPNIIIVGIDEASLSELGRFPWDRAVYAPFLSNLNQPGYEPKAIGFDILLTEESEPESDMALAEALSQYHNVILPGVGLTTGDVFSSVQVSRDQWLQVNQFIEPYEWFAELVQQAHINRVISEDGVIRQTWLNMQSGGQVIPSLAYRAAEMYGADLSAYRELTDPGKAVAKQTITIDYDLTTDDFLTIPFLSVLQGEIPPENFKDAIVIVGFTSAGTADESGVDSGTTPIQKNMKLVYVHGNIINQLLKGSVVTYTPWWMEGILLLLVFGLFIRLPWRSKNVVSFVVFLAAIGLVYLGQYALYRIYQNYFSISDIILAVILAYLANVSLKSWSESVQRRFVTRQFGRYISQDLVKEIISNHIDIKLGGDLKDMTFLFLDIRGFTSLSEKLSPTELVDTLNMMFNMITETTLRNEGTIDKFIGDAAMILFNAPLDVEEHQRKAVKTAYEIQQGMKSIRESISQKYGCDIHVGIGIHTGTAVVGNIGSNLRVDYTAIGDNVNIAARIESQTKKGQIHVSEQVYEVVKEHFHFDEGEDRMFKGKSHPIRVYEVLEPIAT